MLILTLHQQVYYHCSSFPNIFFLAQKVKIRMSADNKTNHKMLVNFIFLTSVDFIWWEERLCTIRGDAHA